MAIKQHHLVYKTTNLVNGKIYIGVHATNKIDDGYLGSGKVFRKALKKYGEENFQREILFDFPSSDEAYEKERELVTEEFIEKKDNYNFRTGGFGGTKASEETKRKLSQNSAKIWLGKRGSEIPWFGIPMTEERKKHLSENRMGENNPMWGRTGEAHSGFGKPLSDKHKRAISFASIGEEEHLRRIEDINNIEKKFGWMAELSKKWGVCNRTGLMFIKKWYSQYTPRIVLEKRFCQNCQKPVGPTTSVCMDCHNESQRKSEIYSLDKETMEKLVWTIPKSKLAKQYKTTTKTINARCEFLGVKSPPFGFFATGKNQYSK